MKRKKKQRSNVRDTQKIKLIQNKEAKEKEKNVCAHMCVENADREQ